MDKKEYELKDHLGNVRVAIGDMKIPTSTRGVAPFVVDEKSVSDFYPGGMAISDRSWQSTDYRYGYNGQEKSLEIDASGNHNTAEYWEMGTRELRRWNRDPKPTIGISEYSIFGNNPVRFSDIKGDSIIVDDFGRITRNDKLDNLVYLLNSKMGLTFLGELGKEIKADYIFKNLLEARAKEIKEIWNPIAFYNLVKNHGDWDIKNDKKSIFGLANIEANLNHIKVTNFTFDGNNYNSQDLGNFNFGVVSKAYGIFGEEFILKSAGEAQILAGTSKKEWQPTSEHIELNYLNTNRSVFIKLPPYGDDPKDQENIKKGFEYFKKHIK